MSDTPRRQHDKYGLRYTLPPSLLVDDINVKDLDARIKLSANLGKIQPKATEFTGEVMIGRFETGEVVLKAAICADELARPCEEELVTSFTTERRQMTFDDIDPPDVGTEENEADDVEDDT